MFKFVFPLFKPNNMIYINWFFEKIISAYSYLKTVTKSQRTSDGNNLFIINTHSQITYDIWVSQVF